VKTICFSDYKNSLASDKLPAFVDLREPCAGGFLKIHLIELSGSDNLEIPFHTIKSMDINELFEKAVLFYSYDEPKYRRTASLMFLSVIHKDPTYIHYSCDTAYYYGARFCRHNLKQIGLAIELFSLDINLTNDMNSLAERGYCYYELRENKQALADFQKVLSMNPPEGMKRKIESKAGKLLKGC
jgi:tetratricopeptide (TPR) repeat protein